MADCAQTIDYLKRWPCHRYEPFPVVTSEKVQKFNMDLNELKQD
jgi:hypothetical protein